jgi:hypothetical protein
VCKWSLETKSNFLAKWGHAIYRDDSSGWEECGGDVYAYLLLKLERRVHGAKPGPAGWAMRAALASGQLVLGVIWCDGCSEKNQTSVRSRFDGGEDWWPALFPVSHVNPHSGGLVPMYCPALAWQNARPWWANSDRLWFFDDHSFASPDTTVIIETPGPVIEELASEVDDASSVSSSWIDVSTDASTRTVPRVNRWTRSSRDASSQTSE